MEMNILDKLSTIFEYLTSSIMNIEILLISFFILVLLIMNIKRNSVFMKIFTSIIFMGFIGGIYYFFQDYFSYSIDQVTTFMLKYLYFPSTVVYFLMMFFVIICLLYTIYKTKMNKVVRVVNVIISCLLGLLYGLFFTVVVAEKINIADKVSLYTNDVVLSIVQISNLIWFIWVIFILMYRFYKVFENNE